MSISETIQYGGREHGVGNILIVQPRSLLPDKPPEFIQGTIEAVRSGGFYGKAIILDSGYVVKTTQPDSWHELWRRVNWDMGVFPPQSSELAAQLDHVSMHIIHRMIGELTGGAIVTPKSYGYADMGEMGFAQIVERMHGRGPRWDGGDDEEKRIADARKQIWALGTILGIEQAAQVHPDNPFGKPNIWIGEDGRLIWLDTLPAIRHTGWVKPFFFFKFHQEVRDKIGEGNPTFNRIHTDRIREYLDQQEWLLTSAYEHNDVSIRERATQALSQFIEFKFETLGLCELYDEIHSRYENAVSADTRDLVIDDGLNRGLISEQEAMRLEESDLLYTSYLAKTLVNLFGKSLGKKLNDRMLVKLFKDRQYQEKAHQFLTDPDFRRDEFTKSTILRGLMRAHEQGLVTDQEVQEIEGIFSDPQKEGLAQTYVWLQIYYFVQSRLIDAAALTNYVTLPGQDDWLAKEALTFIAHQFGPGILRILGTAIWMEVAATDLREALKYTGIPAAGAYISVPAQMRKTIGGESDLLWQATKRWLVAKISGLRPGGGWGSDYERGLWEWVERRRRDWERVKRAFQ